MSGVGELVHTLTLRARVEDLGALKDKVKDLDLEWLVAGVYNNIKGQGCGSSGIKGQL